VSNSKRNRIKKTSVPGPLTNRAWPSGLEEIGPARITGIEKWLGRDWLWRTPPRTGMQTLWHRIDNLAASELFVIADALHVVSPDDQWLKHRARDLKGSKADANLVFLFELVIARMLSGFDGQVVSLADDPTQEGYDMVLSMQGKRVRISCKSVGPSQSELNFIRINEAISQTFEAFHRNRMGSFVVLAEWFRQPTKSDIAVITQLSSDGARKTISSGIGQELTVEGSFKLNVMPYQGSQKGLLISSEENSFRFMGISPRVEEENLRVKNALRKAFADMKSRCGSGDDTYANMVAMRIPRACDISQIQSWCAERFETEFSSIGGVILCGIDPVSITDSDNWALNWDIAAVLNPNAASEITSPPRLSIPMGTTGHPEPNLITMGRSISLNSSYLYQSGIEVYESRSSSITMNNVPAGVMFVARMRAPGDRGMVRIGFLPMRMKTIYI